jgi:hypothetical protein
LYYKLEQYQIDVSKKWQMSKIRHMRWITRK